MKKTMGLWLLLSLVIICAFGAGQSALAEESQTVASAPVAAAGKKLTGWQSSGSYKFYFTKKGKMVTGWKVISKKTYYFRAEDEGADPAGSMVTGWQTIDGKRYYFVKKAKSSAYGSMVTGWKKIGSFYYYFNKKGVMQAGKWIKKKYYVDSDGHKLVGAVTPDLYYINTSGVKSTAAKGWKKVDGKYYYFNKNHRCVTGWKTISGKKYYFDSSGVRQKGWLTLDGYRYYLKKGVMQTGLITIGGKQYYFAGDGKLYTSTTVDGYVIGADGAVTGISSKASVLIIAGHGQGDVGAIGSYSNTTYYEYKLTREFSTLIYNKLTSLSSSLSVTMYDQNYDCYSQVAKVLSSSVAGFTFTGSGAKKTKVLTAIKKNSLVPDFTKYDYVLEVHFNATATSGKDSKGDGSYKGVGMYVNSSKKDTTIDRNIVARIKSATGFKVWGGGTGIFTSSGLLNARTCQELGVSYGLLETAFIDDKDDITFYQSNKSKMANAVANALVAYFS